MNLFKQTFAPNKQLSTICSLDVLAAHGYYEPVCASVNLSQVQDTAWIARERFKLKAVYPENKMPEFPSIPGHFLHPCRGNPGLVEFTPSAVWGKQERLRAMKPGKYLRTYIFNDLLDIQEARNHATICLSWINFGVKPEGHVYLWYKQQYDQCCVLERNIETKIKELATAWRVAHLIHTPIKICRGEDEIEELYINGPNSCMSGDSFHIHPSRVYDSPDIEVLYLGKLNDATARVVTNANTKEYFRIYGDTELMEMVLKRKGYTKTSKALAGCRIKYIEVNSHTVVMPYIDGDYNSIDSISEIEGYMTLDYDGEYTGDESGIIGGQMCDHCGADAGECGAYIEDIGYVCSDCIECSFTYVPDLESYVLDEERRVTIFLYDGTWYSKAGLANKNLVLLDDEVYDWDDVVECYFSEELIPIEDALTAEIDGDTIYYSTYYESELKELVKQHEETHDE